MTVYVPFLSLFPFSFALPFFPFRALIENQANELTSEWLVLRTFLRAQASRQTRGEQGLPCSLSGHHSSIHPLAPRSLIAACPMALSLTHSLTTLFHTGTLAPTGHCFCHLAILFYPHSLLLLHISMTSKPFELMLPFPASLFNLLTNKREKRMKEDRLSLTVCKP
jgi:hypothetical protein